MSNIITSHHITGKQLEQITQAPAGLIEYLVRGGFFSEQSRQTDLGALGIKGDTVALIRLMAYVVTGEGISKKNAAQLFMELRSCFRAGIYERQNAWMFIGRSSRGPEVAVGLVPFDGAPEVKATDGAHVRAINVTKYAAMVEEALSREQTTLPHPLEARLDAQS